MSESNYLVFDNPLPKKTIRRAKNLSKRYAKRFGFDNSWKPLLEAKPMPLGYEEFGIQTLSLKSSNEQEAGPTDGSSEGNFYKQNPSGVVIGTIRMGFGHYRIGLALASAAKSMGITPYWLDFLSFPDSAPTKIIHYLEDLYNKFSRFSQTHRWFNRLIWEKITSDVVQQITYCARDRELTRMFAPLLQDLPHGIPFLGTHPWTGLAAVHAGMSNVVSVVPDNFPLAFHLVEGSSHAVQTPSTYMGYRTLRNMGYKGRYMLNPMPEESIFYAGHFVDHELVSNIEEDCENRLKRIHDHNRARRLLLTIGGAGAQMQRFFDVIRFCRQAIEEGKVGLLINLGDHAGRCQDLISMLEKEGIKHVLHQDWADVKGFAEEARTTKVRGIHLFLANNTFQAVYTTNLLMRACDLMITKPSELSFYPVPKLFIERVGRHEAWGAIRGAEIGDGTLETSSINGLYQSLRIAIEKDDLLSLYCNNIVKNKQAGIYDGAYNAIKRAVKQS